MKQKTPKRSFITGSVRDSRDGKGRFDLLPCRAMKLLAKHFETGSVRYGSRNWERGQPLSVLIDSGMRHLFAHLQGKRDEQHDVAAAWNIMCLIDTKARIDEGLLPKELDDLPVIQQKHKYVNRRIKRPKNKLQSDIGDHIPF